MFVGKYNGKLCRLGKSSPNQSVCISGLSGTGKTCRLFQIELENAVNGRTVLALDASHTHTDGQIFPPIRDKYSKAVNRINALDDGLGLELFKPLETPQGKTEPFVHLVNSTVQALSSGQGMGICQLGALREAVIAAMQSLDSFKDAAQALTFALQSEDDIRAKTVYQKLWTLLNCGALKSSGKHIEAGRINIIDLAGTDKITQVSLSELYLSDLWRRIQFCGLQREWNGLTIALDEFQHFSLKKGSILRDMLREGRKFNINLLLATQSLEIFPKEIQSLLNQTATHLYFRPSLNETQRIAKGIQSEKAGSWAKTLSKLKIGQCIGVGNFEVEGFNVDRPLLLEA